MSDVRQVLLVEDPDADYPTGDRLSGAGFEVVTVSSATVAMETLADGDVDCVVCCHEVPDEDGLLFLGGVGVLRSVRERDPELPFVLFTEVGNEELAREAIAAGVTDYVRRDGEESYERLVARVEAAVARRRAETRADRQARINEVIRDINQALVRSDTRREIEQSVAERLAESEQYVLAWIAEVGEESVSLRAMGVEGAAIEGGGAIDISEDTAYTEPVRRAARDRTPVVVDDPEEGAWEAALDRPPAAVAAIPFVYEDHVYGVLVLYTDRADAFDDEERRVLAEVGENVAYSMNAVAVRRKFKLRELELRRQNDRLEEFASIVSHDLRNPLTVARGYVELLGMQDDEEAVEKIDNSLARMETIIDDVLTLARQGKTVVEPEPVDLAAAARKAWANVDTGRATLEVDECSEPAGGPASGANGSSSDEGAGNGLVEADRSRLVQLLENLFRNAVEHGEAGTVRVGTTGEEFYVADDGVGLPETDRGELFESGYTTAEAGTGFGLAIVRQIAEAHGWTADATTTDEGGARFEFSEIQSPGEEGNASQEPAGTNPEGADG